MVNGDIMSFFQQSFSQGQSVVVLDKGLWQDGTYVKENPDGRTHRIRISKRETVDAYVACIRAKDKKPKDKERSYSNEKR